MPEARPQQAQPGLVGLAAEDDEGLLPRDPRGR